MRELYNLLISYCATTAGATSKHHTTIKYIATTFYQIPHTRRHQSSLSFIINVPHGTSRTRPSPTAPLALPAGLKPPPLRPIRCRAQRLSRRHKGVMSQVPRCEMCVSSVIEAACGTATRVPAWHAAEVCVHGSMLTCLRYSAARCCMPTPATRRACRPGTRPPSAVLVLVSLQAAYGWFPHSPATTTKTASTMIHIWRAARAPTPSAVGVLHRKGM